MCDVGEMLTWNDELVELCVELLVGEGAVVGMLMLEDFAWFQVATGQRLMRGQLIGS